MSNPPQKKKATLWAKIYSPMVFSLAARNLRINKFRTLLSMIGIIIGVFAICSMGMVSGGFMNQMNSMVSDTADTLTLYPIGEKVIDKEVCKGFNEKELRSIESAVRSVTKYYEILPVQSSYRTIIVGKDKNRDSVSIYGLETNDIPKVVNIIDGIKPRGTSNIAVGEELAKKYKLKIGSRITILSINGVEETYRVVGIMENSGMMSFSVSTDNAILGTMEFYETVAGNNHGLYGTIVVKASKPSELNAIAEAIDKKMNGKKDKDSDDTVTIVNSFEVMKSLSEMMNLANLFTLMISGISLLVAAVAIMNVMMMSVKERTREVGILRSIGTFKSQILQMFLYEACIIGVAGSVVGVVLSCAIAPIAMLLMMQSAEAMLTWAVLQYIPIGIGVGVLVCLIAGIYPAWKAANLNPVDAMASD